MRYVKFEQADRNIRLPDEGDIPYWLGEGYGVTCIELSDLDLKRIKENGKRFYMIAPLDVTGDRPIYVKVLSKDPFVQTMKINRDEDKNN